MAYNTKEILKDKDLNPISQYYNPTTDSYEPVQGVNGGNKVVVENNDLSLLPILDKLSQLTGTVIDEETRKTNEIDRKAKEVTRGSNESTRKSNETTRGNSESTRVSQESARVVEEGKRVTVESNRVSAENTRVSQENTRKSNETTRSTAETTRGTNETSRINQENTRKSNELLRIALYDDLQNKVSSGYFKGDKGDTGNGLEYNWNGTQLGIRVVGQSSYVYVNLKGDKGDKGDTGDIASLNSQHVTNALGYTPPQQDTITTINGKTGAIAKADIVALGIPASDTTYTEISTAEIDLGTASTLRTITARRLKYLLDKIVALFPTKVSELTNDSGFLTSVTKSDIGLGDVTNDKQMPINGGTFTGQAKFANDTSYGVFKGRNIASGTANPSGGSNGDIYFKRK